MKRKWKRYLAITLAILMIINLVPKTCLKTNAKGNFEYFTEINDITPRVMYTLEKAVAYLDDLQTIAIPAFASGTAVQAVARGLTNHADNKYYKVIIDNQFYYINENFLATRSSCEPTTLSFYSQKNGQNETFQISTIASIETAVKALIRDWGTKCNLSPEKIETITLVGSVTRQYREPVLSNYDEAICTAGNEIALYRIVSYSEELLLEQTVSQICASFTGATEYEKIRAAHDWICNNADYAYIPGYSYPDELYCSPYQNLFDKKSICQGYAMLFQKFMETMGINSYYVSGYITRNEPHRWNIVQIDGQWYHVDCTWDGDTATTKYDYFLKGSNSLWYTTMGNITLSPTNYPY